LSLDEQITRSELKAKLSSEIKRLESKIRAEKQPRKKYEYFIKLQALKNHTI